MKRIILSLILSLVFIDSTFAVKYDKADYDDFVGKKIGVAVGSVQEKWADGPEELRVFDDPSEPQEINGKLDIITQSGAAPYDYSKNGKMCGLEIELVREFCRKFGYRPVFYDANLDAAVMGVYTGKYDRGASALKITEERVNSVNFADPMCTCKGAMLVKKGMITRVASLEDFNTRNGLPIGDITEFYGKRIGVQSGSTEEALAAQLFKNSKLSYYSNFTDAVVALHTDKIDALYADDFVMRYVAGNIKNLIVLDIGQEAIYTAPIFQKTEHGDLLCSQYNAFLKEFKNSGKLKEITKKWIDGPDEKRVMDTSELPNINGIVTIGTEIGYAPLEYIKDDELVGFEVELLREFCKTYGYRPVFYNAQFDSLIMGVHTGKFDIGAAGIIITEERTKTVNFGASFLICYPTLLVKSDGGWTGIDIIKTDIDLFFEELLFNTVLAKMQTGGILNVELEITHDNENISATVSANMSGILTKRLFDEMDEISRNVVIGSSKSISIEDSKIVAIF